MPITIEDPNVIHLGGPITEDNRLAASGAITPGHLIRRVTPGKYAVHSTSAGFASPIFALDQSMMNLGVDDPYADGDLVQAGIGVTGSTFWALLTSGGNVADGALLESNGDGTLKAGTTSPVVRAIEAKDNSTGSSPRIRVEVL